MVFQVWGVPGADRKDRVEELRKLGFSWADMGEQGEEEAYWMDQLVVMQADAYAELMKAAAELWLVFDKTARFIIGRRDLYEALSIPSVLWDGLDRLEPNSIGHLSRYARFDFAISLEGRIKLLELNADTPTGYVEAAIVTPWMCEQYGLNSPNIAMADLLQQAWDIEKPEYAACIDYGKHAEDSGTIDALIAHSGRTMQAVDCLDLWVDEGIVKDSEHQEIRRMFALYPKEWMSVDDGGEALAYAIEEGFIEIFNSLHAIILQSKGLQAVIWGLHELGTDYFTEEEHTLIKTYMLPSYNMPVLSESYVSKSMFGREGGSVQMYNESGELEHKDEAGFDTSVFFQPIFQERADLPLLSFQQGNYHLLTGLFMLNGVPCGLLGRAGGLITGNTSQFVAIGVENR